MRSIQTRLAAGLLLSLIVLLFIQWLVVASSIRKLSEEYIIARMMHASDLLVAGIEKSKGIEYSLNITRIDPIYIQPLSGYYYVIQVGSQKFRSRSLWDASLPVPEPGMTSAQVTRIAGPQSQSLLVLNKTYQKLGEQIRVTVAEDISAIEKDIEWLFVLHAVISLIVLAILVTLQVFIVRKNLQPLDNIRNDLKKLEVGIISHLDENVPDEIAGLVKELNARIKAVQQRLKRSRRATGNLAHALKTPLTLLMQLSNDSYVKNNAELQRELVNHTNSIQQIINRELTRARVAGANVGANQAQIKPELKALVHSLQAMYREKDLTILYEVNEQCPTIIEREDFHELMGNLLDNACKWANKKIQIGVDCDRDLVICIEDDGHGIPDSQAETILLRGQRLDEQIGGHGLGLSIVKDIVEQYQGTIRMSQSEILGGLMVVINIPFIAREFNNAAGLQSRS